MKKTFILIILFCSSIFYSSAQQYCIPGRFDTTDVFSPADIDSSVVQFGQNTDWTGALVNLFMTIYYPDTAVDALNKRPFVMIIHGGSFTHDARDSMRKEVKYFAAKGYVSATIDYRLGWVSINPSGGCTGNNNLHINAVYRAVQDAKAALRYVSANAKTYRIDSTEMFIGGTSAGAFASLAVAFISQNDFNTLKPGISSLLGPLNSSSNTLTDPYFLKGILSYKGAIWDSTVINGTNVLPTIFIQGTADPYYPYLSGNAFSCSNYFILEGSGSLSMRLRNLGGCYELNYKVNGDHGLIFPDAYTLGRRALFMKKILCEECDQTIVQDQVVIDNNIITAFENHDMNGNGFNAYPNPVSDNINIYAKAKGNYQYEIYSTSMQLIRTGQFMDQSAINFSDVSSGMYLLVVSDKNGKCLERMKIIK